MRNCKQCNKEYDVEELIRTNGDVHWKHSYCSAPCFTKSISEDKYRDSFPSVVMGCEEFTELVEGMSILSDVQEAINYNPKTYSSKKDKEYTDKINHAKYHIGRAMKLIHTKQKLPGYYYYFSAEIPKEHQEKGKKK
jgi:hypothetical protein